MGQSGSHSKSQGKTKKSKAENSSDAVVTGPRRVEKRVDGVEQEEGLGAKVSRTIGREELEYLDPFLLLDSFKILKPAGFPDHPHRGYETVTYILEGCMDYEDFLGNKGTLEPGDVQWLTAGRGMVHSEMPSSEQTCHGIQLWINLTSESKMVEPAYQNIKKEDIPSVEDGGVRIKVIAGEAMSKESSIMTRTPTIYLDVQLDQGATLSQPIPQGWTAFIYTISGTPSFSSNQKKEDGNKPHSILVFTDGTHIEAVNKEAEMCHFLLIAGKPLKEPVEREGNFVMNKEEEIDEAVKDHRFGRNGFENAPDWNSQAGLAYLDSQF